MSIFKKVAGYAGELGLDVLFMKGIPNLFNFLSGVHAKLPDEYKAKIPALFGIGTTDEEIVNSLVGQLDNKDQAVVMGFLSGKCKDYERSRYIRIVAGMEFFPAIREEKTIKYGKDGKKESEATKAGSPEIDLRLNFLKSFARIIREEYGGDLDKAYDHCVGGRMIIKDPLHQKVLKSFSESIGDFKKTVLSPFEVDSMGELTQKVSKKIKTEGTSLSADLKSYRQEAHDRRVAQSQKRRK